MPSENPDVVFKDLCLDTTRPDEVGPFWAATLGLTGERQAGGDWVLRGPTKEHTIWVNTVPEAKEVKTRVHLDVRVASTEAPLVETHEHWTVHTDPDGLEWCAFGKEPLGLFEVIVDSADPAAIATWWAERTGATLHSEDGKPYVWLTDVPGFPYDYWVFNPVPEPKTVKNRVHWDVTLAGADVDALLAAGATHLATLPSWTVLADPEGNEFCVFSPRGS